MSNEPGLIYSLIPKIMSEVEPIAKNRANTQQHYKFRGIDDMYEALQSILAKHGVFYTPQVEDMRREERPTREGAGTLAFSILTIGYTFYAPDGSHVYCRMVGEGMDPGDKASNKAMSTALKYCLMEIFCIPTAEPKDSEESNPEPAYKPRNSVMFNGCPQCKKNTWKPSKAEYGGGFYCDKKAGGCGYRLKGAELEESTTEFSLGEAEIPF
jgi:hypothetical protein